MTRAEITGRYADTFHGAGHEGLAIEVKHTPYDGGPKEGA